MIDPYAWRENYWHYTIKVLWIGDEQGHYYAEIWDNDTTRLWRETGASDSIDEAVKDAQAEIDARTS